MTDTTGLQSQFYVKLNGADAPGDFMDDLIDVAVETSLHMPGVATIRVHDPRLKWVDDSRLEPGKTVEVRVKFEGTEASLFKGEIVEIEPSFEPSTQLLAIRAFDRLHRLARGRQARSFQNMSDGDIVNKLAGEVGLSATTENASQVFDYIFQANETNLEFLQKRAIGLGNLLFVEDTTLHCAPPSSSGSPIELKWSETLRDFHPRLTTIGQINDVTVRGWDPAKKQEVVGQATNGRGTPQTGVSSSGGQTAQSAFGVKAPYLYAERPIRTQSEADRVAQALADRRASGFIEADGVCQGNPKLVAGASINVTGVGTRFSGTYFVTSATHTFSTNEGYVTEFSISGLQSSTLLSMIAPSAQQNSGSAPASGLVVGIVTDNQDPQNMGRVKVKYPWLTNDHASDWARVVAPGAGADRGVEYLPEVDDEVLVGFELGDMHCPYVLGGLWNGKDAPPKKNSEVIAGGKVNERIIKSRSGHIITLNDKSGSEEISIVDKTGSNKIVIHSSDNSIEMKAQGDLKIQTQGNIDIEAQGKVSMKGTGGVDVTTQAQLNLEGTSGATLKNAAAQVALSGPSVNMNNGALEVM